MHSLILVMSLMGSAALLVYFALKQLLVKFFPVETRAMLLYLSLVCFIFPFPKIRYNYSPYIEALFNVKFLPYMHKRIYKEEILRILDDGRIIFPKINKFFIAVAIIYLVFVIVKMIRDNKEYKKLTERIKNECKLCEDKNIDNIVIEEKKKLHIKKNIMVFFSESMKPATLGIFSPVIILSGKRADAKNNKYIIKHELAHIYEKDFLTKILLIAAKCLNWFNPLVYILSNEMNRMMELRADSMAIKDFSKEDYMGYGNAIIDAAVKYKNDDTLLVTSFASKNKKLIYERIDNMKNQKKFSAKRRIAGVLLVSALAFVNSLLVFAYMEYPTSHETDMDYDWVEIGGLEGDLNTEGFHGRSEIFFDSEGNEIDPVNSDEETQRACNHTYVNTTKKKHKLNNSGGCTVTVYNAQYCTKCGNIVTGSVISSTSYTVCPH